MKKTFLTLLFTLATIMFCFSQKIETEKVFGGYKYSLNGSQMTIKDLVKTMKSNSQAFNLIKKAQSNNIISSILGYAGGGLIGFPIGSAISGGDANWTLAGIGAGLVAIGIPISSNVNKKTKQAIDLYNSSLSSTSFNEDIREFKVIANGNGIGFLMSF